MYVGVLRLTLQIPAAHSLKQRRQVVRSFRDRLRAKLRVSVAEVGALEQHQRAVIGVAVVSNDAAKVDEVLAAAARMADTLREAVLVDRQTELIAFGDEGGSLGVLG
ncbi:MAG TPA: DUF503 domain-containing protein [Sorangium sp.]|nr:DUF503 domain-containing protein [Sorangium sp.]